MTYEPEQYEHLKGEAIKGISAGQLGVRMQVGPRHQAPRIQHAFMENLTWSAVSRCFGILRHGEIGKGHA